MVDIFVAREKEIIQKDEIKTNPKSGKKPHLFSSFIENPVEISFHHQEEDENVILFLRSHLITNLSWMLLTALFIILPIAIKVLNINIFPFEPLPNNFMFIIICTYYLFIGAFVFYNFLNWYYNVLIVTNLRIIDVDFADIVFHDVAETRHHLIQDVSFIQTGSIRSLFNYGDIYAQTAGGNENIEALGVPKPLRVSDIITSLMKK